MPPIPGVENVQNKIETPPIPGVENVQNKIETPPIPGVENVDVVGKSSLGCESAQLPVLHPAQDGAEAGWPGGTSMADSSHPRKPNNTSC